MRLNIDAPVSHSSKPKDLDASRGRIYGILPLLFQSVPPTSKDSRLASMLVVFFDGDLMLQGGRCRRSQPGFLVMKDIGSTYPSESSIRHVR